MVKRHFSRTIVWIVPIYEKLDVYDRGIPSSPHMYPSPLLAIHLDLNVIYHPQADATIRCDVM